MKIVRAAGALAISFALTVAGAAQADVIYSVSMDTSAISGGVGYAIAFQLNDGSGGLSGDGNNTVTLTDFAFGGGAAGGCPCTTTGGAAGDATSSITLTDSDFFNSFAETFTPGNGLSFKVNLTTNVDAGGTPDLFAFSILFKGVNIPTQDDQGADTFLSVNIDSSNPTPVAFGTLPGSQPAIGAPIFALVPPGPLPEPGSLLLMGAGLAGLVAMRRRKLN